MNLPEQDSVLSLQDVSYRYGNHPVLEHVSLTGAAGECIAIAGVNGSGKSTLLSIMAGVRRADEGSMIVSGHDLFRERKLSAQLIGYVPQDNPLILDLSVADNLKLWSGTKPEQEDPLIRDLELDRLLYRRAGKLSGGEKRRLVIACALLKGQRILIMDEPTSALDLNQKELIHRYISGFTARDGLVIMATHDIMEMQLSNRLYLLNGHSLCETDPQEALRQLQHSQKGVTKDE